MVSQVGLNTSVNMALPALKNNNNAATNTNGSLFTNYNSIPVNDYSNDVFMSNMNFSQLASGAAAQGTNQAAALQTQQQTFEGGVKAVTDTQSEPEKSNKFKILGVLGGALTPVALKAKDLIKAGKLKGLFKDGKILEVFKSGKLTKLFTKKELLVSCPIFAVVGLGLGMLLDSCFATRKANKNAQNDQVTAQQQQEIIKNFVTQ